ncbi:TetR/AcrR family transcriptional regulator [Motiliproteus sp. MSK22-1]|uniref:TetR/AcrR family transcriptional regulator n=1 Tax=Motiliproteus sp. MSK22-1 TaxID=1897630 RepID=UPI000976D04B|nr:TetR/AcrR family transcriptional regulator [Motiliproteus sp. MSK22-1]OMH32702.1 hypothetical protein BGP75_14300 [Motiliproteus sp. MSK22-1]
MPRPRIFDEDRVLQDVMKAFWRKGYLATSAEDLVKASGLGRSSLYNTFSSKAALFERSLDCYLTCTRQVAKTLSDTEASPEAAIREVFISALEPEVPERLGCLVTNTAIELAGQNERIAKMLQRHFDLLRQAFTEAIKRGQRNGEFNAELDPTGSAELLLTLLQGIRVQSKSATDSLILERTIDQALRLLH